MNDKVKKMKLDILQKLAFGGMALPKMPTIPKAPGITQMKLPNMMGAKTVGAVTPIGPLAKIKEQEQAAIREPLTTPKGMKESLTKKLKPKV